MSPPGPGERKYSYTKTTSDLVVAWFLGGADDTGDLPAVIGGTYYSELTAEVTVYEKGVLTELREKYDATNPHGLGIGVDISVARSVVVEASDHVRYELSPFAVVGAGEQGISEKKGVWMSARQRHIPSEALMSVAVIAENSLPIFGAGTGWSYSLNLLP